jgi:plasmid rolling circle replication initiator protein Rep
VVCKTQKRSKEGKTKIMTDKSLEQHIEEWSAYRELLKKYLETTKDSQTKEWTKERLKSLNSLLSNAGVEVE